MDSDSKNQDSAKKTPFDDLSKDELITKCKGLLVIAQKAKLELHNEKENLKSKLQKCEAEKKTSLDNNETLQELVDSLTEQKLNYITEIDAAQARVKTFNEKWQNHMGEINRLRADIIAKDKNIAEISQKLSDFDNEIISLKRQNNRLLDENEQLITQLSDMEAKTTEFNNIGLQQREQLEVLEKKIETDDSAQKRIMELNDVIIKLKKDIEHKVMAYEEKINILENKAKEMSQLYESEKVKTDKSNVKLKTYKDKILKCAACINQLKNSRFILTKTVKEYSENVPKWQSEIIKASKVLDSQINELNKENNHLKETNKELESKIGQSQNQCYNEEHKLLSDELNKLKHQLLDLTASNSMLTESIEDFRKHREEMELQQETICTENKALQKLVNNLNNKVQQFSEEKSSLLKSIDELNKKNRDFVEVTQSKDKDNQVVKNLNLQIKALESEKAILVKEKLNARDNVLELENGNKMLTNEIENLKRDLEARNLELENISKEISILRGRINIEKDTEIKQLRVKITSIEETNEKLKKDYDDLLDLNGLLKEEVETLKLSLEEPKDDNDHLSDLNVSLQADIVKLETKLSAYKQENSSLLTEAKESRVKVKEFDNLVAELENSKSKLLSYKTENTELLNEMKEINQVLKERGEAISKLQKAISEMERLIDSLERDRNEVKQERDDLVKKIDNLESDLTSADQIKNKHCDNLEKITTENDKLIKMISEKESIIINLKEDLEKLKQQATPVSELPNDDMSTSTISKAEEHSRMKDLDESFEDKYTKLRIFALKLKKKLNEVTTQLHNAEQEKTRLQKLLNENEANTHHKSGSEGNIDVTDNSNVPKIMEKQTEVLELQEKIKSLTMALEASEKSLLKLGNIEAELQAKNQQLMTEKEMHKTTKENLDKALKDVKKKNVLSLEMEDYERSMKELTAKMEENKKKIVQMESTIDTQEGTIIAMKTQIKLLEEQIKTEETQNRLLKEELHNANEEIKEKDNIINSKKDIILKFVQDLEAEKRKTEESELEMTSILSEKEKLIVALGEEKTELINRMKRLEFKCADTNEKLRITNIELADLKTEYTSYKVRAQAVLRQNQTVDHSQEEQLKEEAAALAAQTENLKSKLATLQEQFEDQNVELEATRKRATEATSESARAHQRTTRLQADLTRIAQQLESERSQHKLQVSTLTQCYKAQISELEAKLQKETEALKAQLAAAQDSFKAGKVDRSLDKSYMLPVIPKDESSDGEMDINVSMIPREEGEGSESAPSPPLSKPYLSNLGGRRSPVPLERLLEEGVPEDDTMDSSSLSLTPEQEIAELRRKLQGQQLRVKHVTVLLAESERECARMAQLSELLKSELRRVRGATANAHNTEYMKNVTFKFLTLPPGDERTRLIPVLQKILTLSPEETQKIQAIAKGQDPSSSKGWGSYLPWPGSK